MLGSITWALMAAVQAPDIADEVGCVLHPLTQAERVELSLGAQRGDTPGPAMQERLQALVGDCAGRYGWDGERAGAMTVAALSLIIVEDVGATLASEGIDPAHVSAWLDRQSEALRTSPMMSAEDGERVVLDLHAVGIPLPTLEANAQRIGAYLGALIMMNRVDRGLPIE